MATHKKKKSAAKKTAKKTATKKKPAVKAVARRSTNRLQVRPADAGLPPKTVSQAAVDALVKAWTTKDKHPSDYVKYREDRILKDASEMAAGREDLPLFSSRKTPVTAKHFDWLDLLIKNFQVLGDEDALRGSDKEMLGENGQVAVQAVVDARNALARRAQASGIPLSLFTINRGYGDAFALYAHAGRAARLGRQRVDQFRHQDEKILRAQFQVREDEAKMIQTSREALAELEQIFEADRIDAEAKSAATGG